MRGYGSTIEGDEAALLALELISEMLGQLRERGVLGRDDVTGLLEATAQRLRESKNSKAKSGARYIVEAMLPVHRVD